jgi:medium-chain acyl-[acyl-carrier-protein] hydrolase
MGSDQWVVKPRVNPGAALRLFCLPYAGGGSQVFRSWAARLPAAVEVCPIELPGRGVRLKEPLFTAVPPLVEALAQNLEKHLDKPFAFFGHSMGGLLSFELTRYFRRHGLRSPAHVFVSGRGAPQMPGNQPPMHTLPEPEFISELGRLNGTPKEVLEHAELMQLMLPILRADFSVCETYLYEPEPPLDCPITAFGGTEDDNVSLERLQGWCEQTTAAFAHHVLPGGHFFLHTAQPAVLQLLSQGLTRVLSGIAGPAYK